MLHEKARVRAYMPRAATPARFVRGRVPRGIAHARTDSSSVGSRHARGDLDVVRKTAAFGRRCASDTVRR